MSILNWQVSSFSNFPSFLNGLIYNYPVNFKFTHFLLWIKVSHQSPKIEAFECPGENFPNSSCYIWKGKSVFLQILHQFSVPSNITPPFFFRSNIYFGQKHSTKVCKALRFLSVRVKIHQILHANFGLTSQLLFKFFIILHCHGT